MHRWPDFLIVGAAKSGTSAVYRFLSEHPKIYFSEIKEPNYFASPDNPVTYAGIGDDNTINASSIWSTEDYLNLFSSAASHQLCGEASTLYLYDKNCARNIAKQIPQCKIIIILRNPVDRAYSAYQHLKRDGRECASSFEEGLLFEQKRIVLNWEHLWHYANVGFYCAQVKNYLSEFDASNVKIILYEDFLAEPKKIVDSLFSFLSLDEWRGIDTSRKFNVSGQVRSRIVQKIIMTDNSVKKVAKFLLPTYLTKQAGLTLKRINLLAGQKDVAPKWVKDALGKKYKEDILELELLIERDLSAWRNI